MRMKKIYTDKDEKISSIIHKVITAREKEITLFIPKGAIFERGEEDFHLLSREARAAKKDIKIESFDEQVLEMAVAAGLKTEESLFQGIRRPIIDILPQRTVHSHLIVKEEKEGSGEARGEAKESRRGGRRRWTAFGAFTILAVGIAAAVFLPKAKIDIVFKKTPWVFSGDVVAAANIVAGSFTDKISLPGQFFEFEKNSIFNFPASGEKYVESKAVVDLTVYNAYSSLSQKLVKSTRFVSPDGKIFRLTGELTIPGAKVENGKIIPSSIAVKAEADKAGGEYNIGPISRLNIPGFQKTAKYEGFYGEIKGKASGGYIGKTKVPTAADIASAKDKAGEEIAISLDLEMNSKMPKGFSVLEGATETIMAKETASPIADSTGNFQLSLSAKKRLMAFKEESLLAVLTSVFAGKEKGDFLLKDYKTTYGKASVDFSAKKISFKMDFSSNWIPQLNQEDFKSSVLGLKESRAREAALSLKDLERVDIELWPFWVRSVTKNPERVIVTYD